MTCSAWISNRPSGSCRRLRLPSQRLSGSDGAAELSFAATSKVLNSVSGDGVVKIDWTKDFRILLVPHCSGNYPVITSHLIKLHADVQWAIRRHRLICLY